MKVLAKYRYKNVKFFYYVKNICLLLLPRKAYQLRLQAELNRLDNYDREYVLSRVNYYNKKSHNFNLSKSASTLKQLKKHKKNTYFFDLYGIFSFFNSEAKLDYIFGDVTSVPDIPSIVKSRPVSDNVNSIILKLNKVRHFHFIRDNRAFLDKEDRAVWRGAVLQEHRKQFVKNYYMTEKFDIGQTKPVVDSPWFKGFMSIYDQLAYKFIFCIEGNDVATNLKWVMSSNSVCVMPKPKYETWFMEGTLKSGVHYIEVKDDFSDAEEKIAYYIENPDEALKIIDNAHAYVEQFKDSKREKLISLLVLEKYFALSKEVGTECLNYS